MAVDGDGNILVSDYITHRIQKFTEKGEHLTVVGEKGSGPLQFCFPEAIAFNVSNDKLYVVDWNDRVQVLNSDLTFSATFGKEGGGRGQFNNPNGIACDEGGKVYVADSGNHRIQVFTPEGKFSVGVAKTRESSASLTILRLTLMAWCTSVKVVTTVSLCSPPVDNL